MKLSHLIPAARLFSISILSIGSFLAANPLGSAADNWPQFRGPNGDGKSEVKGLPVTFGETEHVRWKTAIHGKAWSSPVTWGQQIWLTTATPDGKQLSVLSLDKDTGKILSDQVLFEVENPQFCHDFNSYASSTPVIEEGRIYVTFGSPGTACLDTSTGKVLWQRRDLVCNHFRGAGSSPVLFENLLLMNFDGSDFQYAIGLDKKTGKDIWKTARSVDFKDLTAEGKPTGDGDFRKAFATPQVVDVQGTPVLLGCGAKAHYGYDARTGRELWRFDHGGQSASSRPVVADGVAFLTSGYGKKELHAIKLGLSGALDDSALAWKLTRGAPIKPSLTIVGDWIFLVEDGGFAACIERQTGKELWRERVPGNYSASPLFADGRIYLFSESGAVTVLAAAAKFEKLGEGKFESGFMASPVVLGKGLLLRTKTDLIRIE